MLALTLDAPKNFRFIEVDEPAPPTAGEALVRVHSVGVRGTDVSGYLGKMPQMTVMAHPTEADQIVLRVADCVRGSPKCSHCLSGQFCCPVALKNSRLRAGEPFGRRNLRDRRERDSLRS